MSENSLPYLLNVIEPYTHLKRKASTNGGEWAGPCPFCKSFDKPDSDRFRVWPNQEKPAFWCRICGRHGNAVNFIAYLEGISYYEAAEKLGLDASKITQPHQHREFVEPPRTLQYIQEHFQPDYEQLDRWAIGGHDRAVKYFSRWGLTEATVDFFGLGYGEYKGYWGYTIPRYWTQDGIATLAGVKIRSDDTKNDPAAPRYCKYMSVHGSVSGIFNDRWTGNPDGSRRGPELTWLLVFEAEKEAMLAHQEGYPAIAFKQDKAYMPYLKLCLGNVAWPIIVADNDGGTGLDIALKTQGALPFASIISHRTYKNLTDLVEVEGVAAMHQWLHEQVPGIEPLE